MNIKYLQVWKSIFLFAILFTFTNITAQNCYDLKDLRPETSEGYSQILLKTMRISKNQPITIRRVLYGGRLYRFDIFKKNMNEQFSIRLLDGDGEQEFWNNDEEAKESLSISFGSTQTVILEIALKNDLPNGITNSCVGLYLELLNEQKQESIIVNEPPKPDGW